MNIANVDFSKVRARDTVWVGFGFSYRRAIIKAVTPTGIIFTLPSWLKKENRFMSFVEMQTTYWDMPPFMGKRYSKLRWALKL